MILSKLDNDFFRCCKSIPQFFFFNTTLKKNFQHPLQKQDPQYKYNEQFRNIILRCTSYLVIVSTLNVLKQRVDFSTDRKGLFNAMDIVNPYEANSAEYSKVKEELAALKSGTI